VIYAEEWLEAWLALAERLRSWHAACLEDVDDVYLAFDEHDQARVVEIEVDA
jgi:hypothetical protein